ncbi:MAG: DUF4124 domain-containing protein, partial [Alcanivorax sp.]|nr:DUF4124 domain-containing protein [Alcanivorax sp.]
MRYLLIIIALLAIVLAVLFNVPLGGDKPLLDWQHVEQNWQQPERLLDREISPWMEENRESAEMYRWRDP